jgi:hypothetical protein
MIIKKKALLAILMCLSFNFLFSQLDTTHNRLAVRAIDSLINEKNYTRIPNEDFDELIDNKVATKINEKFTFWITLIGVLIGAIAGVAAYAFNNKMKQLISEQVTTLSDQKMESIRRYILDSRKYTLRSDLEVIKNKINTNPKSEANIIDARRLLEEIKEFKNPELLSDIIDLLAVAYSRNRNPKEIEKLIETNEGSCEIKETTYMNAAILYMDLYELDGSAWYKENSLKYCKVSAQKVPHYGEPQGIMLLTYAIDYVNNPNKDIKQSSIENAKKLIDEILTGSDFLTAYYTVDRLNRDKKSKVFNKYIFEFETVLSEEFSKLYERSKAYSERKHAAGS